MVKNNNLKSYSLQEATFKIHGRTDEEQCPLPLFWNGSGIEINVTGTELWIDIEVDYDMFEPWAGCAKRSTGQPSDADSRKVQPVPVPGHV